MDKEKILGIWSQNKKAISIAGVVLVALLLIMMVNSIASSKAKEEVDDLFSSIEKEYGIEADYDSVSHSIISGKTTIKSPSFSMNLMGTKSEKIHIDSLAVSPGKNKLWFEVKGIGVPAIVSTQVFFNRFIPLGFSDIENAKANIKCDIEEDQGEVVLDFGEMGSSLEMDGKIQSSEEFEDFKMKNLAVNVRMSEKFKNNMHEKLNEIAHKELSKADFSQYIAQEFISDKIYQILDEDELLQLEKVFKSFMKNESDEIKFQFNNIDNAKLSNVALISDSFKRFLWSQGDYFEDIDVTFSN
jgi:hypothetical protein